MDTSAKNTNSKSNDKNRSLQKLPTDRASSLERLQNQLYQAQASGNTVLMKQIKAIMDRIKQLNKN